MKIEDLKIGDFVTFPGLNPQFVLHHKDPLVGIQLVLKAFDDHVADLVQQRAKI
jgi:hypothetical protein